MAIGIFDLVVPWTLEFGPWPFLSRSLQTKEEEHSDGRTKPPQSQPASHVQLYLTREQICLDMIVIVGQNPDPFLTPVGRCRPRVVVIFRTIAVFPSRMKASHVGQRQTQGA